MISYEPLFRTMKEKGVTSYRLGKLGFPLSNFYAMKHGDNVSTHTINQLCRLLQCRVEDVMEYIDEEYAKKPGTARPFRVFRWGNAFTGRSRGWRR